MAAGVGSRFGGTKQLAEVGPNGEALLDYTIYDARQAGFEQVALIVRDEIREAMAQHLQQFHGAAFEPIMVCQDLDPLAPPRAKPWGTGQAILALRDAVKEPFAVVNADDIYGAEAFVTLAAALRADTQERFHLMAYRLDKTLSPLGTVSRGVCTVTGDGLLSSVDEQLAIERHADGRIRTEAGTVLSDDTPVSMNLWGLRPALFDVLRSGFETFVSDQSDNPKAEFQLPTVIDGMVQAGTVQVVVHRTSAQWLGMTYPGDLVDAKERIAELVKAGQYQR